MIAIAPRFEHVAMTNSDTFRSSIAVRMLQIISRTSHLSEAFRSLVSRHSRKGGRAVGSDFELVAVRVQGALKVHADSVDKKQKRIMSFV